MRSRSEQSFSLSGLAAVVLGCLFFLARILPHTFLAVESWVPMYVCVGLLFVILLLLGFLSSSLKGLAIHMGLAFAFIAVIWGAVLPSLRQDTNSVLDPVVRSMRMMAEPDVFVLSVGRERSVEGGFIDRGRTDQLSALAADWGRIPATIEVNSKLKSVIRDLVRRECTESSFDFAQIRRANPKTVQAAVVDCGSMTCVVNEAIVRCSPSSFDKGPLAELRSTLQNLVSPSVAADTNAIDPFAPCRMLSSPDSVINEYLAGRSSLALPTRRNLEDAIYRFESVSRLCPQFALAYSGLADALALRMIRRFVEWDWDSLQVAERAAQRAYDLDRRLPESNASLGLVHLAFAEYYGWRAKNSQGSVVETAELERLAGQFGRLAEKQLIEAVKQRPRYAENAISNISRLCVAMNYRKPSEARKILEEMTKANPRQPIVLINLGYVVGMQIDWTKPSISDVEKCKSMFLEASKMDETIGVGYYNLACIFAREGDLEKSIENFEKAVKRGDFGYKKLMWEDQDLAIFRQPENSHWMARLEATFNEQLP